MKPPAARGNRIFSDVIIYNETSVCALTGRLLMFFPSEQENQTRNGVPDVSGVGDVTRTSSQTANYKLDRV